MYKYHTAKNKKQRYRTCRGAKKDRTVPPELLTQFIKYKAVLFGRVVPYRLLPKLFSCRFSLCAVRRTVYPLVHIIPPTNNFVKAGPFIFFKKFKIGIDKSIYR